MPARPRQLIVALGLAAAIALPLAGIGMRARTDIPDAWQAQWQALAADADDGFVVWESDRTGRWRIWRRDLDGDGLRQLTPDDPARDHFCPHLAPDGTRLVYLSVPAGISCYDPWAPNADAVLRMIGSDGAGDRVLAPTARAYLEDRAALWVDDDHVFYIDGGGVTRRLTVSTGASEERASVGGEPYGWLLNATETHATAGWPTFSPYDSANRRVLLRNPLDGCQPYFTRDGRWGFWMAGVGGPIDRYDLTTRESGSIVTRSDPRLPDSRGFVYFPMVSACQTLFAFAASPHQLDHFVSDYDVFVAPIDPFTLELTGAPVRYTFDPSVDRYPDVHGSTLRLGAHRGTAPFAVDFTAAGEGFRFDFGDGSAPGADARHTYSVPGAYRVVATRAAERLRGYVRVDALTGPVPLAAALVAEKLIEVRFDRAVRLGDVTVAIAGADIEGVALGERDDVVVLTLARTLLATADVELTGVEGKAPPHLPAAARTLRIALAAWPVDPDGLVFAFEHARAGNLAREHGSGDLVAFTLEGSGPARFDRRFALEPSGGAFTSDRAAGNVTAACRETGLFTCELAVEHAGPGDAELFALGPRDGPPDFALAQRGDRFVATLRTSQETVELDLQQLPPQAHVTVGFRGGARSVAFARIDGNTRVWHPDVAGDLGGWRGETLRIGRGFTGTIHHVACFARERTDEETERDHGLVARWRASVPQVAARGARATLVAKAVIPTLESIKPYREALAVFEYASGKDKLRVAHWVIRNGEVQDVAQRAIGTEHDLLLEPFAEHPEAVDRTRSEDGLAPDLDAPLWFAR